MSLIQNSGDLLNVIIAISVLLLTFFICWVLFYVAMSLYNVFKITKEAREGLKKAHEVLDFLKKRLKSTLSYVYLLEEIGQKMIELIGNYKENKKTSDSDKEKKGKSNSKKEKKK
ncbi:hypothetical protein K8R62_00940 [bacterium]|nr:hypothetical protein [bacterium]